MTQTLTNPGAVETAIAAVLTAYKGLQRKNGYRFDVKHASRHYVDPDSLQPNKVPAIFVTRPLGASARIAYYDGAPAGAWRSDITLQVIGYVRAPASRNPDDAGLATLGEAMLSDIRRVAVKDWTFGGRAKTQIVEGRFLPGDQNDAGFDSAAAMVVQPIEITVLWEDNP